MRNKKNVSERRDKTYLRNELKLTYHYILSYIYNTFIVRHYKRRIYFRNIKRTDSCDCLQRNAKGTHLYSRWAYKRGGLSSGWAYIRNNIYSRWQMDGLISGGGFKVGFYGTTYRYGSDRISHHNHRVASLSADSGQVEASVGTCAENVLVDTQVLAFGTRTQRKKNVKDRFTRCNFCLQLLHATRPQYIFAAIYTRATFGLTTQKNRVQFSRSA